MEVFNSTTDNKHHCQGSAFSSFHNLKLVNAENMCEEANTVVKYCLCIRVTTKHTPAYIHTHITHTLPQKVVLFGVHSKSFLVSINFKNTIMNVTQMTCNCMNNGGQKTKQWTGKSAGDINRVDMIPQGLQYTYTVKCKLSSQERAGYFWSSN